MPKRKPTHTRNACVHGQPANGASCQACAELTRLAAARKLDTSAAARKERAIARLHSGFCPVPMWQSVGFHFQKPKPACTCGAELARATQLAELRNLAARAAADATSDWMPASEWDARYSEIESLTGKPLADEDIVDAIVRVFDLPERL